MWTMHLNRCELSMNANCTVVPKQFPIKLPPTAVANVARKY